MAARRTCKTRGNDLKVLELRAQLQAEQIRVAGLQERLADKDAMLGDLREDRDRWRSQAERLVITDQREKTKQAEPLLARLWGNCAAVNCNALPPGGTGRRPRMRASACRWAPPAVPGAMRETG